MPSYSFKKRPVFFLAIISVLVMTLIPAICLADADKIYNENNQAVVVVMVFDKAGTAISQGSGFIVRADGVIVTNYHVISNARSIKIKAGGKVLNVEGFINLDKENDVALLKVNAENLPLVKLGDLEKTGIGEKVYVISSPQGLENTISDGILSGKREITPKLKILQITAPVSSGSSGAPVFNKNGEVIGIATFLLQESQNLNFAMPVDVIKNKLSGQHVTAIKDNQIDDDEITAEHWFHRGVAFAKSGMHREAIEAFKQALLFNPYLAEPYYNLGVCYGALKMYQEATDAYRQAIRIRPDYAQAYYNLGMDYSILSMNREAIEAYMQAIRIEPDYAQAYFNVGYIYAKLGNYKESINAYKQATRIQPDFAEAYGILALRMEN